MSSIAATERPDRASAEVRRRYGKALIRTAWGLEAIAAAIGLFIALATAFATHAEILEGQKRVGASEWMTIFIGALPFLMVAIVELMKIPLATAFYLSRSMVWRLIFITSLILLIGVTFETMLNGFQRQYESRVHVVTDLRLQLNATDEGIAETERRIADLQATTADMVRREYDKDLERIRKARESDVGAIDEQRSDQVKSAGLTPTTAQKQEIENIRKRIQRLREQQGKEVGEIRAGYQEDSKRDLEAVAGERARLDERLGGVDERIAELDRQKQTELNECTLFCSRDAIRERYAPREEDLRMQRRQLNDQLAELDARKTQAGLRDELDERTRAARTRYDERIAALERRARELAREIDKRESRSAETVKPIVAQLDARRQEILDDYRKQSNEADARFRRRIEDAENRAARIAELQAALAARQSERNDLRSRINVEARKNQIYQIAALWYGRESPVDVTKDELKFISAIWFGTLAFIVAVIGTVLALAGLVLRYHEPPSVPRRPLARGTLGAVRRAAVEFRRRLRQRPKGPKVVYREVPVDKVVRHEVAKEVIVKEMVYVPLYTTDPALLNIDYGVGVVKGAGRSAPVAKGKPEEADER